MLKTTSFLLVEQADIFSIAFLCFRAEGASIGRRNFVIQSPQGSKKVQIKKTILNHITTVILSGGPGSEISSSDDMIDSGLMDSLALMRLIQFLEEEFDIEFDGADIVPDNFQTVDAIVVLLEGKTSG